MLLVNFNELNQKDQRKRKRKKETACCHHLLHNTTTIKEGENIVVVTFFAAKPSKKATVVAIAIFCSKAIEEGDGSCHLLLFIYNTITKKGNGSLVPSPSLLQHNHRKR
jgi:hypothetical protein